MDVSLVFSFPISFLLVGEVYRKTAFCFLSLVWVWHWEVTTNIHFWSKICSCWHLLGCEVLVHKCITWISQICQLHFPHRHIQDDSIIVLMNVARKINEQIGHPTKIIYNSPLFGSTCSPSLPGSWHLLIKPFISVAVNCICHSCLLYCYYINFPV